MIDLTLREASDLGKSTLIVGVVFTIASKPSDPLLAAMIFGLSILCAGAGFFLHELMHKFAAQRMGYSAEYMAGDFPYISILVAFAGWILLSPGAVHVSGASRPLTTKANGIISFAGPITNLALAGAFWAVSNSASPLLHLIGFYGADINIWLAVFNTVPAPGFDGAKMLAWDKTAYIAFAAAVAAAFLLMR